MHGTDTQTLARLPLLRGCNRRQLMLVGRLTTAITVPPERVLCEQGEPGQHFYVMLKGRAAVIRDRRVAALLGPGDWFGEMAFLAAAPAAQRDGQDRDERDGARVRAGRVPASARGLPAGGRAHRGRRRAPRRRRPDEPRTGDARRLSTLAG